MKIRELTPEQGTDFEGEVSASLLVNPRLAGVHGVKAEEVAAELDGHQAEAERHARGEQPARHVE